MMKNSSKYYCNIFIDQTLTIAYHKFCLCEFFRFFLYQVDIDGPYGTPSSHIFHATHAVLIAAGIGVTPFASILQSIMNRYYASKQMCPRCDYCWNTEMPESIMNLKKVPSIHILATVVTNILDVIN